MSNYTPKSEEQLVRESLLPDSIRDFEVAETDGKPSSKGNPMITLKLHVFDDEGNARIVMDYISLNSNFGERKFRHAADACGILEIYNTGSLTHTDFKGKTGKVSIKTQEGTKEYPNPKNVVHDYIKREEQPSSAQVATTTANVLEDDEVPF